MGKQQDVGLKLTLEDDATAVWQKFSSEVEAGSKLIATHGKEVSRLSQFVREQKSESRQQTFLFRESHGVVQALIGSSRALGSQFGQNSALMGKVNETMSVGMEAFQAADFSMAALGVSTGGTAIAIAGLVAGGAALYSFLDRTKTQAAIAEQGVKNLAGSLAGMSQKEIMLARSRTLREISAIKDEQAQSENPWTILGKIRTGRTAEVIAEKITPKNNMLLQTFKKQLEFYDAAIPADEVLKLNAAQMVKSLEHEVALLQQKTDFGRKILQAQFEMKKILDDPDATDRMKSLARQRFELIRGPVSGVSSLNFSDDWKSAINQGQDYNPSLMVDAKKLALIKDFKETTLELGQIFDEGWQTALQPVDQASQRAAADFYNFFSGQTQGVKGLMKDLAGSIADQFKQLMSELAAQAIMSGILGMLFPTTIGFDGFAKRGGGLLSLIFPGEGANGGSSGGGKGHSIRSPYGPAPSETTNSRSTIIFNNYAAMTSQEAVLQTLGDVVRGTGQTIDKLIVNNRAKVSLAT